MHTLNVLLKLISVVLQIVAIIQRHRGKNQRGLPRATGDKIRFPTAMISAPSDSTEPSPTRGDQGVAP